MLINARFEIRPIKKILKDSFKVPITQFFYLINEKCGLQIVELSLALSALFICVSKVQNNAYLLKHSRMTFRKVGSSDLAAVTVCRNLKILFTFIPQFSAVEIVLPFAKENTLDVWWLVAQTYLTLPRILVFISFPKTMIQREKDGDFGPRFCEQNVRNGLPLIHRAFSKAHS